MKAASRAYIGANESSFSASKKIFIRFSTTNLRFCVRLITTELRTLEMHPAQDHTCKMCLCYNVPTAVRQGHFRDATCARCFATQLHWSDCRRNERREASGGCTGLPSKAELNVTLLRKAIAWRGGRSGSRTHKVNRAERHPVKGVVPARKLMVPIRRDGLLTGPSHCRPETSRGKAGAAVATPQPCCRRR